MYENVCCLLPSTDRCCLIISQALLLPQLEVGVQCVPTGLLSRCLPSKSFSKDDSYLRTRAAAHIVLRLMLVSSAARNGNVDKRCSVRRRASSQIRKAPHAYPRTSPLGSPSPIVLSMRRTPPPEKASGKAVGSGASSHASRQEILWRHERGEA